MKSEVKWAAHKRRCVCHARSLEPKFKHSNLWKKLFLSYLSISIFSLRTTGRDPMKQAKWSSGVFLFYLIDSLTREVTVPYTLHKDQNSLFTLTILAEAKFEPVLSGFAGSETHFYKRQIVSAELQHSKGQNKNRTLMFVISCERKENIIYCRNCIVGEILTTYLRIMKNTINEKTKERNWN